MYEHKKIKWILTDCLDEMYSTGWRLAYYDKEVKISVWDREIKKTRTPVKPKEPQKAVTKYFNENTVKWLCSFYKDLEEAYFDWVRVRAECGKFKEFSDVSEKSAWKKLGSFPKPVAESMLENAGSSCYWKIYDLTDWETTKILEPIRQEKQKVERKREGFDTDDEKKQAEVLKNKIQDYIKSNPSIKEEARLFVEEKHSSLSWVYKDKMIQTKMASLANNIINK